MTDQEDVPRGPDERRAPEARRGVEKWLHGRFPDYPRVVEELYRETRAAVTSWAFVVVLGLVAVHGAELGSTFVDALRHAGLVLVGLAAAWWPIVGGFDLASAGLWFALFRLDQRKAKRRNEAARQASPDYFTDGTFRTVVIVINRHFLHAWALLASAVLLLLLLDRPWQIVVALASLLLLGPALASWVGLSIARHFQVEGKDVVHADLSWLRRPAFYAATLIAIALLFVLKGAASYGSLICFSLLVFAGVAVRFQSFRLWLRNYRRQDQDRAAAERRRKFRSDLARATKVHDVLVVGLVLLSPAVFPLLPVFDEQEVARASTLTRVSEWADRADCEVPLGPEPWDVQVFLVADNQFRALDGKPSMGHSPVIDRVVPVAVRPIELDLLSGATLDHFARTYQAAKLKWKNLKWAHLGDFSDLGCRSEMARLTGVVESFGGGFLGMTPGNHDSYFTGNFAWHPDWTEEGACPGGGRQERSGEGGTNEHLEKLLNAGRGALVTDAMLKPMPASTASSDGWCHSAASSALAASNQ